MSTPKNFEHPLAQNSSINQNDKKPDTSTSSKSDLTRSESLNLRHQQFAKKRRESIIKMAPDIHPALQAKRKLAIKCENVCLTYGEGEQTNYVLNGLTLSVPKGEIYGLLGPSGCGKTSLLKIICGLLKAEYGTVKLFGFTPGTLSSGVPGPGIGYMPQELALQSDLTIGEMLAFYGRLCLLDEKTIASQTEYLVNLLELPAKDRFIASLSGGQKRRVSLAVTLIHKPRLVILDEPTVGVDPLLCQKIWELLIDLSVKDKMTIIITTHYIEETKRANLVGFMRKGQILAEGSPERLMEYYDSDTLENVFYKLCLNQKQRKTTVQQAHPTRRQSIIRTESIKSAGHRLSLKRSSIINLNKNIQEMTPKTKPRQFARQGSFTSSFGEYAQQIAKFQDQHFNDPKNVSKYSTPIGSPQIERDNVFHHDSNNNQQAALKKKNELDQEHQLELRLIESQKFKKMPLEDISVFPIQWERFKTEYNWNPILTWIWLVLITSYKLGLQTVRQPLFLLILYIFPTFIVASLYLCIGHTPKEIKVGLILDEKKDHRHRWDNFPNISCNPRNKLLDYDYLFKMYDDLGIKNNRSKSDVEFDYVEDIGSYDRLRVPYIPEIILGNVNKEIIYFVNYTTVAEARQAVKERKIWAYLHFKKEFSRSFLERDIFIKANNPKEITNAMIDQGTLHLSGDFSDLFMSGSIQLTLYEALVDTYPIIAKRCGIRPKAIEPPVSIGEFVYGEYTKGDYFGVRDFAAPGFIMCITYSISMGLCTLQTLLELQDQMFVRNFSVGLSAGQIVAANIIGRIFFLFGSVLAMLLSAISLFQIPMHGSYVDALHILVLQTLVGMTNGLFFATLLNDLTACLFVSLGFLLLIFFISGVFWPLEALPYYVKWFSKSMPFTVPGETFRTVLIRKGAPVSYIYPGILMSYVWLFVFLSLSYWSIRRKKYE